jgi:hypothetical protein
MIRMSVLTTAVFALAAQPLAARDPLQAVVDTRDADRFAALFVASDGQPTEEELEDEYIAAAGDGLALMRDTRFGTAAALSAAIAQKPGIYLDAIERCLPHMKRAERDLQAIYLALSGLFPDRTLPRVEVVFGAGTAAGIASQGIQVIGLETLCASSRTEGELRGALRYFFAHETIHSFQPSLDPSTLGADPLLSLALHEGIADMVAAIVLGRVPDTERHAWASARREVLMTRFHRDRQILKDSASRGETLATMALEARDALRRWHFNHGNVPDDWHSDLGYWIGRQIASAYVDQAADRREAIYNLVRGMEPIQVLEASGLSDVRSAGAM